MLIYGQSLLEDILAEIMHGKPDLTFKSQDPLQSSYSKRIKDEEWETHEVSIRSMHVAGKTGKQILTALWDDYAFCPSYVDPFIVEITET